jgi:hypothetical protein
LLSHPRSALLFWTPVCTLYPAAQSPTSLHGCVFITSTLRRSHNTWTSVFIICLIKRAACLRNIHWQIRGHWERLQSGKKFMSYEKLEKELGSFCLEERKQRELASKIWRRLSTVAHIWNPTFLGGAEIWRISIWGQPRQILISETSILTNKLGVVVCACDTSYIGGISRKISIWGQTTRFYLKNN